MLTNGDAPQDAHRLPDRFRATEVVATGLRAGMLLAEDLSTGAMAVVRVLAKGGMDSETLSYFSEARGRLATAPPDPGLDVPPFEIDHSGSVAVLSRRFVDGDPIDRWFERSERSLADFVTVAARSVAALECLHAQAVVHGNVKSQNLLVAPGRVALVDYGLERVSALLDYKDPSVGIDRRDGRWMTVEDDALALGRVLLDTFVRFDPGGVPTDPRIQRIRGSIRSAVARLAGEDGGYQLLSAARTDLEDLAGACLGDQVVVAGVGAHDLRRDLASPSFVERPAAWASLTGAFDRAREERAQAVLVHGPAGIGKTRLVQEFSAWARDHWGARVVYAKSDAAVAPRPHLLSSRLDELLTRVEADSADGVNGDRLMLSGEDPPAGELYAAEAAQRIAGLIGRLASPAQPLLVVIDDCHFAGRDDSVLVQLLAELTPTVGPGAVVVFVHRGDGAPTRPSEGDVDVVVSVAGLPADGVRSMLRSMTGQLDDRIAEEVIDWSGGNPFQAQSAMRFLLNTGAVVAGPDGWRAEGDLPMPPGVLAVRIRSLSPRARSMLVVSAAIGLRGRVSTLALATRASGESSRVVLDELILDGLLQVSGEEGVDDPEFCFTHDTIREAALEDLDDRDRSEIHGAIAEALLAQGAGDEFDLAFHLARAGDHAAAAPHAIRAARQARARYSLSIARQYFEIALAAGETRRLLWELGEVLMLDGSYEEAVDTLTWARSHHPAVNPADDAETLRLLGETYFKMGALEQANDHLIQALQVLGEDVPTTDRAFLAAILRDNAALRRPARFASAEAEHAQLKARIYSRLAYCMFFHNSIRAIWAQVRQRRMVRHLAPDSAERAYAHATAAVVLGAMLGRGRRAAQHGRKSLAARMRTGDTWGEAHALHLSGVPLLFMREYERAIEQLGRAIEGFDRTGDRWEAHTARWHRGAARYRLGDLDGARRDAEAVRRSAARIGDQQSFAIATVIAALAADGQVPADTFRPELFDGYDYQRDITLLLGRAIQHLGRQELDEAAAALDEAARWIRERHVLNAYVAPVFSWRATVARWQAEVAAPRSGQAMHRAARSVGRTGVAGLIGLVYPTEREHAASELRKLRRVVQHTLGPSRQRSAACTRGEASAATIMAAMPARQASPTLADDSTGAFQIAVVTILRTLLDADRAAVVHVPQRTRPARVTAGQLAVDDLEWLQSGGYLDETRDRSCVRFQTAPPRWSTFLLLPISGRGGVTLVAQRDAPGGFSDDERRVGGIIRNGLQQAWRAEERTEASAVGAMMREETLRMRFAAELHDEIGQRLSALLMETRRLENFISQQQGDGVVQDVAGSIRQQLAECSSAVRELVYETSPPTIAQFGLTAAVRDLAERVQLSSVVDIDVTVEIADSDDSLAFPDDPGPVEIACFRVIQEAITNVVKHAQAQHCAVTLSLSEKALSATIEDDGIGMPDPDLPEARSGFGLTGMRERVAAAGGAIAIDSVPGAGTVVRVMLPLEDGPAASARQIDSRRGW